MTCPNCLGTRITVWNGLLPKLFNSCYDCGCSWNPALSKAIQVIKVEDDYRAALAEAERLVAADPAADSADGRHLELLAVIIADYESRRAA